MTTPGDPVAAFRGVRAAHRRCLWLDGGGARDWSRRRSILGWLEDDDVSLTYSAARREVTRHAGGRAEVVGDDPFVVLEAELAAGPARAQWFGYFGYAARPDLAGRPDPDLPDAVWMRPSHLREFDHPLRETSLAARETSLAEISTTASDLSPAVSDVSRAASDFSRYEGAFERVREELYAGNSYEVNLTHRIEVASEVDPATAYLRLRELNPAPYAGFLQHDVEHARAWLLSSSPERYALVTADRTIETKPIKGTTQRGATPEKDEAARVRLATDPKFRAENLMITDLLRNDVGMVSDAGTVTVPGLMQVESYAAVHQLVSTIRGHLRDDVSTVAALRALFPAGSMTGAPKLRTMEIIEAVESTPRGVYAGAFGWVSGDGRADLGVVIRSLTTAGDGIYRVGTGGGITVGSDPAEEYAETRWKAERVLAALAPADSATPAAT